MAFKHLAAAALGLALVTTPALARQRGEASWYGGFHEGRPMANGRPFRMRAPTVAHRTLPLGTQVRVRNLKNGRATVATVTDRGPYAKGRVVDLSRGVAQQLRMVSAGHAPVEITVLRH